MSTLWVLGLGASLAYLHFKGQTINKNLDTAVKQYHTKDVDGESDVLAVRQMAWRKTDDVKNGDFHERLPDADRSKILNEANQQEVSVRQYEAQTTPQIVGVWLEGGAS